ncbi:hypothetical protein SPRG_21089 [Saprolegnia parasitica CBS 223.65]|uniref:Helicase ATP-binding domain-containing protein n=1 Tax=Saprolegnia parasitica (strain CBS 223.65) TaxID=695850 RepID=A0A067BZL8_SAPPC|nr:hypothetical protein SPRG_21089 [Saprolegnia parasitica CBS 223.65]KDO22295.1 hypothetical protein SPRG_21089 [Saprolegnia parasitica CBS 223.65]|eukprot:XP_012207042.1 hypothetical protein SPRG_21089 [Saprolegnia parasitica CBS 223.65]
MNLAQLLEATTGAHRGATSSLRQRPPRLKASTTLHAHQEAALAWMVGREAATSSLRGGVLADGPGLGKTLTTLSCLQLHPSTDPTLIVVPNALLAQQWLGEMALHFEPNTWSTLTYNPRKHEKLSFDASRPPPVVLVSLHDLGLEWHLFQSEQSERGRATSVLFHVRWQRIIVDEVQDILGAGTSLAASMVQALDAQVRWGLSATPLSKPIDMLGLAKYLALPPFDAPAYWSHINPSNAAHVASIQALLQDIVWRTPSTYAVETLQILPRQTELPVRVVHMSALEFAAYQPDYDRFTKEVAKRVRSMRGQQSPLPLAGLRRVLSHPSTLKLCKGACHVALNTTTKDFGRLLNDLVRWRSDACIAALETCLHRALDCPSALASTAYQLLRRHGSLFRVPSGLELRLLWTMRELAARPTSVPFRHEVHKTVLALRSVHVPQFVWRKIFAEYLGGEDFTDQIARLVQQQTSPLYDVVAALPPVVVATLCLPPTATDIANRLPSFITAAWTTDSFNATLADASQLRLSEAASRLGTYERWVDLHKPDALGRADWTAKAQDVYARAISDFGSLVTFAQSVATRNWKHIGGAFLQAEACQLLACGHMLCGGCCAHSTPVCPLCARPSPFPLSAVPRLRNPTSGSKFDVIVDEIASLQDEATTKCIVFSQWPEALSLLQTALSAKHIASLHLQRTSQTSLREEFQSNPNARVLLLPLKKYNHGLNLVEATHVFLVEPTFEPALQEQAMARVQRLSQTQTSYVHRYVMAATVEARMYEWTSRTQRLTQDDVYRVFTSDVTSPR